MTDLALVDALARLQLEALRAGYRVVMEDAPDELTQLIRFVGLEETLGEVRRQSEQREEHVGVEEERELPDLPA